MEDIYVVLSIMAGMIVYDGIKYIAIKLKRRWGENPSDATYGGKR